MASPVPSEEERRLLREYRVVTVPPRKPSSASTSTSTSKSIQIQSGQEETIQVNQEKHQQTSETQPPKQLRPQEPCPPLKQQQQPQQQQQQQQQQHSNHKKSHHHHHHHHHHQHRLKSPPPTKELTPEEISRMLELASDLRYMKLVSPKNIALTTTNGLEGSSKERQNNDPAESTDILAKSISRNILDNNNRQANNDGRSSHEAVNSILANENGLLTGRKQISNGSLSCVNSTPSTDCLQPYIFEKVDYIKKIAIRRKALKKLRRAANKSRVVSPNTNTSESQNIKL